MIWLLATPFIFQGIIMFVDEFIYHHERGLPRWERLGHPLDTLTILVVMIFVLSSPVTPTNILIYVCLALFSCLFVTKDEFVHNRLCKPGEQWLHSILFVLHPLMFMALGLSWPLLHGEELPFTGFEAGKRIVPTLIFIQVAVIVTFGLYQFLYWNFLWKEKK